MSRDDFAHDLRDCGGNVAAYALGALEADEAEAFRQHLERCAVCRDELVAFTEVVDALPMAAPQYSVPRELRGRVMRGVRAERGGAGRKRRSVRSLAGRVIPWPALAGALAIVAVLIGVAVVEFEPSRSSSVRVIRASVTGASGSARVRIAGGRAELIVNRLPPPPAGRIYEIWVQRGSQAPAPTSALFSVTAGGFAEIPVPASLHRVSAILVTQEPAGGSRHPTHPPVIVARLTPE